MKKLPDDIYDEENAASAWVKECQGALRDTLDQVRATHDFGRIEDHYRQLERAVAMLRSRVEARRARVEESLRA